MCHPGPVNGNGHCVHITKLCVVDDKCPVCVTQGLLVEMVIVFPLAVCC